MRLQQFVGATWISVAALGTVLWACNKSDGDGDKDKGDAPVVTAETKADATKASVASASAMSKLNGTGQNGSGLLSTETRLRIRELYRQGQSKLAMVDEADDNTFEINCDLFNGSEMCEQLGKAPPKLGEGGPECAVTCPEGGGMNFECTVANYEIQCGAEKFTLVEGKMSSATKCTDNDDGSMTLDLSSNSDMKIKGGTIVEPVALKCAFNMSQNLKFDLPTGEPADEPTDEPAADDGTEDEDGFNTDKLCESFSCTVDGVAIACEDMKAAMEADTCGEPATAE